MRVLTQMQCEILGRVLAGWTDQQIADQRKISLSTVKTHMVTILAKLEARNRAHAAVIVFTGTPKDDYLDEVTRWNRSVNLTKPRRRRSGAISTFASPQISTNA